MRCGRKPNCKIRSTQHRKISLILKFLTTPFGFALERVLVRWWGYSLINVIVNWGDDSKSAALLLVTRGRKTGKKRSAVLPYHVFNAKMFIVGSKGGGPADPYWVQNLRGDPEATVYILRRRRQVRARIAAGEERAVLWAKLIAYRPIFDEYQKKATNREIPLVILDVIT
jgi:deazaflavin-dependent oxidoreductase (nitroreductase family)